MKSQSIETSYKQLRAELLGEILNVVKQHEEAEIAVEFDDPIHYGMGMDEQDNPPEIEDVTSSGDVIVFYQGEECNRIKLEHLETEKLIEILKGMEKSLAI